MSARAEARGSGDQDHAVVSGKLRAYLDLIRIPNVITAVADIIAGFLFVGGSADDWAILLLLAAASSCLYGGGVVLNDYCDVERDARERPDRPIPSGRVSRKAALCLTCALLGIGFALAASFSRRAGGIAALLIASIVLYDRLLKTTVLAPALMGLCRALNLALAMSAAGLVSPADAVSEQSPLYELVPLSLMWLYVTSVTYFARHEAGPQRSEGPGRPLAGTIGICLAVGGLASLYWTVPQVQAGYLGLAALLGVALGYRGFAAAASRRAAGIQNAVQMFVVSLVLFDTCLVWAARGAIPALAVAALVVPTVILRRFFRVT